MITTIRTANKQASHLHRVIFSRVSLPVWPWEAEGKEARKPHFPLLALWPSRLTLSLSVTSSRPALVYRTKPISLLYWIWLFMGEKKKVPICKISVSRLIYYLSMWTCMPVCVRVWRAEEALSECVEWMMYWMNVHYWQEPMPQTPGNWQRLLVHVKVITHNWPACAKISNCSLLLADDSNLTLLPYRDLLPTPANDSFLGCT